MKKPAEDLVKTLKKKLVNLTGNPINLHVRVLGGCVTIPPADYTVALIPEWDLETDPPFEFRRKSVDKVLGLPRPKNGVFVILPDEHTAICALAHEPGRTDLCFPDPSTAVYHQHKLLYYFNLQHILSPEPGTQSQPRPLF